MPARLKMASKRTQKCRGKRSWCAPFAKRKPGSPSFEAGLIGLSLFGEFLQFLLQGLLLFLLQLWVAWAGIYFAGLVFSLSKLLLRPFVVDMNFVGLIEHGLSEADLLRGYGVGAFPDEGDGIVALLVCSC